MDVADAGNVLKRQTLSNEWLYVPIDKDTTKFPAESAMRLKTV